MRRRPVTGDTGVEVDGNVAAASPAAVETSPRSDASSWTIVVCSRPGLTITAPGTGRTLAPGDELDLAAQAAPGCTWREAIGDHLTEFFVPRDGEGA